MRALKMLGLAEDGATVLCEEPVSGEQFAMPVDERVRTALRANPVLPVATGVSRRVLSQSRSAQLETGLEPQLRPREIQSRIRGGATLEQVAQEAGCEPSRIERFAYPVLMERAVIADRGRQARPMIDGVPSAASVEKLVQKTLSQRGQASSVQWDAYRDDEGAWVLRLTWNAGRSENTARWALHLSAGDASLTALDDAAAQIVDPTPRPLRTVPGAPVEEPPAPPLNPLATQHVPEVQPVTPAEVSAAAPVIQPETAPRPQPRTSAGTNKVAAALAQHAATAPAAAESPRNTAAPHNTARNNDAAPRKAAEARTGTDDAGRRSQRPAMPSWEDVLLGVRAPGR